MKTPRVTRFLILIVLGLSTGPLHAQVPQLINYQGRVVVGSTNFNGTGQFKFALVNAAGTTTYWSNNNSSVNGSEPSAAVSLTVTNGLYSVLLGDTSIANMTSAIPASVFNNADVRLRVWFNDGTHSSQLLSPDQRIASVGYANIAANVSDGAITGAKIASGTVTSANIANGAIGNAQLGNGAVNSSKIDTTTVQQRVSGTAPSGSFLTGISQDGTVTSASSGNPIWSLNGSSAYYNAGNVGIGTASPANPLTLLTPTSSYGLEHTDGTIRLSTFVGGSTGGGWLGTLSNHNLSFFVNNGGSSMTVGAGGTVGIGTTTPDSYATKLIVLSSANNETGVWGRSTGGTGLGVVGSTYGNGGTGVSGFARGSNGYGVYGDSGGSTGTSYAGYFTGNVSVNGTLTKTGGSFKIDHPLDPANKYLSHSFVESPDMMNIYNGNVTTDASGEAIVILPEWFEALNRDFRYQLTVIGQFAQAIIGSKVEHGRFLIKTDKPNVEVSWQVTGIRQDAWANAHRIPVEEDKPDKERGSYLHPDVFAQPPEKRIGRMPLPNEQAKAAPVGKKQ